MRKNYIQFVPGEPLPSTKHNGLVLAAGEQSAALMGEHEASGKHSHVRFEFASGCLRWASTAWKHEFGDRSQLDSSASRTNVYVEILDDGSVPDHQGIGIVAMDTDGHVVPYSDVRRIRNAINVRFHPESTATEFSFVAYASRFTPRTGPESWALPGIVWEDGEIANAFAGEHIGAEHINAATRWTRRYWEAATREHGEDGFHNRGFQCVATLEMMMPSWQYGGGLRADARVISGQHYNQTHTSTSPLFTAQEDGFGAAIVTMTNPIPEDYFIHVGNAPQPFPYSSTTTDQLMGRRIFGVERLSDTEFRIDTQVLGSGLLQARLGSIRSPIIVRIFADRREAENVILPQASRHQLVEGGLGEVIPAEMYQDVADFQRAAVDHLDEDHERRWNGVPEHSDLRWAKAVALVEIINGDSLLEVEPEVRVHFSHGFRRAPTIKVETRRIAGADFHAWWLDWETSEECRGFCFGARSRVTSPWAHLGPGQLDGRDGWLRLGNLQRAGNLEDGYVYEITDELNNIRAVMLALF